MSDTKVYSEYPVIVQYVGNTSDMTSSMDGSTNPKQILGFQKWANKFKFKEKKLVEDGKWGPKTSAAWKQFGPDFEAAGAKVAGIMNDFQNVGNGAGSSEKTEEKVGILDKIGSFFGKAKDAKDKAQGAIDKAKDLKNKIGGGAGAGAGDFDTEVGSSDEPSASKSKTGKILLWTGVGLAAITVAYFVFKPNTTGK